MGIEIDKRTFADADYSTFSSRVEQQLEQLQTLMARPGFGQGVSSLGSELELYIIDDQGRPAHCNQALLARAQDPQLTLELDRYNLEFNLTPRTFSERGLLATEQEILDKVSGLDALAREMEVGVVPIGILPTLNVADFGRHSLTDRLRYHALVDQLVRRRGEDFDIDIDGPEPLKLAMSDITLEGANTSFQVHWRINPEDYAATYNAVQLLTPLVLAISANSPGIFGHDLWDETRIPLFKQSIDTRHVDPYSWNEPARVSFGQGWVRKGALELFQESVRLFPPLLPCCGEADGSEAGAPELAELRLHQSTVWLWNRPIYDDADNGHLRIELRSLPAGPTAIDMVAGAALMMGLATALRDRIDSLLPGLPFALAERNFYRAAQAGIDARLIWPHARQHRLEVRGVSEILRELLPLADLGLQQLEVSKEERDRYLGVIDTRVANGRTGARWQRLRTAHYQREGLDRQQALARMFADYRRHSHSNVPVSQWPSGAV